MRLNVRIGVRSSACEPAPAIQQRSSGQVFGWGARPFFSA